MIFVVESREVTHHQQFSNPEIRQPEVNVFRLLFFLVFSKNNHTGRTNDVSQYTYNDILNMIMHQFVTLVIKVTFIS